MSNDPQGREPDFIRGSERSLNADPEFDPIRADPRFAALVARVGLPK